MTKPGSSEGEIVVLYECGDVWREQRIGLSEGLVSGQLEFISPGLLAYGWVLSLLGTAATLRHVGTLGASWKEFEMEERVQLWIPGALDIPKGVVVQVAFSEGP